MAEYLLDYVNRAELIKNPNNIDILAKLIDHTLLKIDAQTNDFLKLFDEANQYSFKSVCVPPCYVKLAKRHCQVLICTVIGFPNGYNTTKSKVLEIEDALENGADELDFVNNLTLVKSKEWELLSSEYLEIVDVAKGKTTKLILETSLLSRDEIVKCTELAVNAGVNIIKTSTGFGKRGASIDDIDLIQETLQKICKKNNTVGIKASGGVRTFDDAYQMIQHGATRIGTSNGVAMMKQA